MSLDPSPASESGRSHRSPLRKVGLGLVIAAFVYLSGVGSYQILSATLWPKLEPTKYTCREGTRALFASVERARERTASLAQPERQALSIFRAEVEPVWRHAPTVRSLCKKDGDRSALSALRSVELLRYAEERAVRYQALDLTRWRSRAPRQVRALK